MIGITTLIMIDHMLVLARVPCEQGCSQAAVLVERAKHVEIDSGYTPPLI